MTSSTSSNTTVSGRNRSYNLIYSAALLIISVLFLVSNLMLSFPLTLKTNEVDDDLSPNNDYTYDENYEKNYNGPLNIIIFYPDDWTHDDLGGVVPVLKTPFLTELAKEGIRFTHNAVTTSICWISRATLFSGQYVSKHASMYLFRPYFAKLENWEKSWPSLLQRYAGYYTGLVGKWQFERTGNHQLFNFARMYHGDFWWPKDDGGQGGENVENDALLEHVCDKTKRDAIEFLYTRPKDKPFALTVSLGPPKGGVSPQDTYKKFYSLYEHAFFPEHYNESHAYSLLPWFLQDENSEARKHWRQHWAGNFQKGMKAYYGLISQVDETIADIVEVLKEQGVFDKTMIIFTADNGEFRGAHGLAHKWYPYQESIRVPLIIKDPRMPKQRKGTVDNSLTLNVDLATTILGAAGIAPDKGMQGRDMSNLYLPCGKDDEKCKRPWRSEFYYEFPISKSTHAIEPSSALVRKEWKFLTWKNYNYEQLFNLKDDPLEMNDLANITKFDDLKNEMRARHNELQRVVMSPIVPGTKCDPIWPAGSDTSNAPECCCVNETAVDLNEFMNS